MLKAPFPSRVGLVENLGNHLSAGGWAAMVGGPMIGKSTLTQNLADRLRENGASPIRIGLNGIDSPSAFWAVLMEAILHQGLGPDQKNPYRKNPATLQDLLQQLHHIYEKVPSKVAARPMILLLDDCDPLPSLPGGLISQIVNLALESVSPSIHSICWIGGPAWEERLRSHPGELTRPVRLYPLSVIPIREAKKIIKDRLGPEATADEIDRVWNRTGGHPFLLENAFDGREERGVGALAERLLMGLKTDERAILERLDRSGDWTMIDALRTKEGLKPPKESLDRLCMTGLIVRTLMEGTAAVRITSPLLIKAT